MIAFLKPGLLERRLPGLDALLDRGAELVGHLAADVEDDRLLRLGDVGRGVLLLQPPPGDVLDVLDLVVLDVAVVLERLGEEADAVVVTSSASSAPRGA